jgi:hypothetical protein
MTTLNESVHAWLETAQAHLANGGISADDLEKLRQALQAAAPRQRLLYLHAKGPSITAPIIGMAEHEPVAGYKDLIRSRAEWPYNTVHDAIVDGWQVIHFPQQMTPFDDRELDYVGFEFILQKIEVIVP